MNLCASPTTISPGGIRHKRDEGFTLIEILIAIVLVGILSAVAVVGISNLVSKGTSSACGGSADAARAASAVYFTNANTYPADFFVLTTPAGAAPLTLPAGTTNTAGTAIAAGNLAAKNGSWTLTMTAGTATAAPVFTCS